MAPCYYATHGYATHGQSLLIRSLGITGLDEGRFLSYQEYFHFWCDEFNSLVPRPPAKRKAIVVCESDDDDVVIVGSSKGVSGTPVRPSKRRRLPIRPRLQVNAESDSDSDVVVIDSPPPHRRLSISTPQRRLSISTRPRLSISTHPISPVPSLASSLSTGSSTRTSSPTTPDLPFHLLPSLYTLPKSRE
ncbi:hypothetical protein K438DRAFT_1975644 [Mycena galopus ATCC 62051]|nr:hypothetical protein K438DRAFT_2005829 [Mycena galopus ATCC 62051]KAF8182100.1 hypothetical protein K438DRAFT_1975644 [Mycena galopus ATCC 62051]